MSYYVTCYDIDRCYGGPEEGGWWYDNTNPCTELAYTEETVYQLERGVEMHERWECESLSADYEGDPDGDCERCIHREYVRCEPIVCKTRAHALRVARFLTDWHQAMQDQHQSLRHCHRVAIVERRPYESTNNERPRYE